MEIYCNEEQCIIIQFCSNSKFVWRFTKTVYGGIAFKESIVVKYVARFRKVRLQLRQKLREHCTLTKI